MNLKRKKTREFLKVQKFGRLLSTPINRVKGSKQLLEVLPLSNQSAGRDVGSVAAE